MKNAAQRKKLIGVVLPFSQTFPQISTTNAAPKLGHVSIERAKQNQWKVHNERRAENAENREGRCQSEAIEKQLPSVLQIVNFVVRSLHITIAM